jgi:hypothetical protein
MAKEKGTAKVKGQEKESAECQRPVRMQGQGAVKDRKQKAEGRKQKGGRATAKGGTRQRGQAHLPNLELDDSNSRAPIERLSKLD